MVTSAAVSDMIITSFVLLATKYFNHLSSKFRCEPSLPYFISNLELSEMKLSSDAQACTDNSTLCRTSTAFIPLHGSADTVACMFVTFETGACFNSLL
jgi:hypothetical protein